MILFLLMQLEPVKGERVVVFDKDGAALAKAFDGIAARQEEVFGIKIRKFALTFVEGRRVLVLPKPDKKILETGARWEIQWARDLPRGDYLRHEVAHLLLLEAEVKEDARAKNPYGTALPDWMDEAAAVLAEESLVAEREATLRSAVQKERLIPLKEFFTMHHPGHDEASGKVKDPSAKNLVFYAQCRGFPKFIEETYGLVVMHQMVKAAQKGDDMNTVLDWMIKNRKKLKNPDGGLPDTIDALDADWRAWAATK